MQGIIIKGLAGFYYIKSEDKIYCCKARGIFRKNNISPLVGDIVKFTHDGDDEKEGVIDEILPRRNSLVRPAVANIDKLFIVSSTVSPVPNTLIIDKTICIARINSIEPILVITKNDLRQNKEFEEIYKSIGIKIFKVNYDENSDFSEIKQELKNSVSVFTGNSGVGKSTLLNNIFSGLNLETAVTSKKLGRGRHTTRHTELFEVEEKSNAYVADTPGFSTVDLQKYNVLDKDIIAEGFDEFLDYLGTCKFVSCTHTCEKGCEILKAVENGKINKSRIESYISMYNEIKDVKQWQVQKNV